jgi:HepT-like protein
LTRAELQRLRAELASDLAAFDARAAELDALGTPPSETDGAWCALAAVALHHAYGAIEAALTRVAKSFDGLPGGAEWHQELLSSMGLDIDTVRPAVLSAASLGPLRKLLAFRHFFRHAYAATWDPEQLSALRLAALDARAPVDADFRRFDEFMRDLVVAAD